MFVNLKGDKRMELEEIANRFGTEIQVNYYHNQDGRYTVSLKWVDLKGDGVLIGKYGDGKSVEEATNA